MSPPIHTLASSQGAVFLINSRQRNFCCNLPFGRQALSRSYGCFFAEFLEDLSLVRLSLLDHPTCVGFGTVCSMIILEAFLGRLCVCVNPPKADVHATYDLGEFRICLKFRSRVTYVHPIVRAYFFPPSLHRHTTGHGILTVCPSTAAFRHCLRTD